MPATHPTAQTILTSEFWDELADIFSENNHAIVSAYIANHTDELETYSKLTYRDLPFWDDLLDETANQIAATAYLVIGTPFSKIFDALTARYNPLENYFTDRTYSETGGGSNVKTGKIETTPTGSSSTSTSGTRERSYDNHGSTHQGTTYDENGDSDFVNISKDTTDGTVTESFTDYGTTTSYDGYKVTQNYQSLTDTATSNKGGSENRSGSSGIFSKQDLTQREIELRLKNEVAPILVRMVVDVFNTGVWRE